MLRTTLGVLIQRRRPPLVVAVLVVVASLTATVDGASGSLELGARLVDGGKTVRVRLVSSRAEKVDLYLYDQPIGADEKLVVPLARPEGAPYWSASVPLQELRDRGISGTVFYGFRVWGPNWPFDDSWSRGSDAGFLKDVDEQGNRFNPNKLVIDPYARELSHDPRNLKNHDGTVFASGPDHRLQDTGRLAPKGVLLTKEAADVGDRPRRPLREEIIYEVHVRGLTMLDPSVPKPERGTYRGAARKADYFKKLGVTAVEFLPVQESDNDGNDIDPDTRGDNYWGYATLGYFAPDRRYASDKSFGGPTREFQRMVKAFHDAGIKVYLDVVYNHTGEGGLYRGDDPKTANVLCWRGIDNPSYYELTEGNQFTYDDTGVGGNFNAANPVVRDLILDSLRYWSSELGVDGFRFDLAPILGNALDHQRPGDHEGFVFDKFDPQNPLNRAVKELPVRPAEGGPGVDLIAEPWGADSKTQMQGEFPSGWAEWNDRFRDTFRKTQNKLGFAQVTPGDVARRFAGSDDLYRDDGRKPWQSINTLVAHDGPCLRDLYSFNNDGRIAWNQGGDPVLQRQATRNGFALPLLSAGVPMFTGGDEMYRTQLGNDNPYDVDNSKNYIHWNDIDANPGLFHFARRLIAFRRAHPALRPAGYLSGTDHDGNGRKDVAWYRDDGREAGPDYMGDPDRHYLGFRLDGAEVKGEPAASIFVGYNAWKQPVEITLPPVAAGKSWYRVADTAAWMEPLENSKGPGDEDALNNPQYQMKDRSLLLLIEK